MKKQLLLSFDLEEFERAGDQGFSIGYEGGQQVQSLLAELDIPATFFTTASFAEQVPDFIKELAQYHEIAFHGLRHQDDYQTMEEQTALNRLHQGKMVLEHLIEKKIQGFRAPRMRPPSYHVLHSAGFSYSSSLHPTYVPGRYNLLKAPCTPFREEGVLEIPVSVSPVFRFPLSWIWFRTLGLSYAKLIIKRLKTEYVCIYFHPWEFVSIKAYGRSLYTWHTGTSLKTQLRTFLQWILPHTRPVFMSEFAREYSANATSSHHTSG